MVDAEFECESLGNYSFIHSSIQLLLSNCSMPDTLLTGWFAGRLRGKETGLLLQMKESTAYTVYT